MIPKSKLILLALPTAILLIWIALTTFRTGEISPAASAKVVNSLAAQPAPNPVVLTDQQGKYPLGLHLELLEDPGGKLTIQDVTSQDFDTRFTPNHIETPNFGYTDSAFWARLRLDNETRQTDQWVLEVGFANMQYVDLYTPQEGGQLFNVKQTGLFRPVATRDILYPHIVMNLSVPPHSQQTIYLRFQNGASMTLPLTLWTKDAFLAYSQKELLFRGLLYGAIFALLLYHLFLLVTLRDARYLYFVLLLASLLGVLLVYDGYMGAYILPDRYAITLIFFPLCYAAFYGFMGLFSDTFLELRTRLPKLHWMSIVYTVCWVGLALLIPFTSYHTIASLMTLFALASLVAILIAGIASWLKGFYPARFFMLAWLGFIAGFFLIELVRVGTIPSTFFTENFYQLGFMSMAIGWSIALSDRINLLKAKTERAVQQLQNSELRLSQILDGMPLGVMLYEKDHKPKYANRRSIDILSSPAQGIKPDISAGRTLARALEYFSIKIAGSREPYPIENYPVYSALQGSPASADDIEMVRGDEIVPLEVWASPIRNETGIVESAVLVFQDITQRKQAEAELVEYRKHLESLVEKRTAELNATNQELRLHLEWLAAINLVNETVARSADFTQIYQKIVEIINQLLGTQDSFIAEFDAGRKQLKILAHSCQRDYHPNLIGSFTGVPPSNPDPGKPAILSRDQLSSMEGPVSVHFRNSELQSVMLIPLQMREQVLGYLGLEMRESGRTLTTEESGILNIFSTDIAQLIEDARLFEQAKTLIAENERTRLARELHDSVAQALYSISLFIDATRMALETNKLEVVKNHLNELVELSREAMSNMRLLIFELRPPILEKDGLSAALQSRLDSVEARAGFQTAFESEGVIQLSENQESELYWIAQEALNNVIKHAHAHQVTVRLIGQADCIRLVIEDDGVGFDPDTAGLAGGQGFRNMRERAESIDARYSFVSAPDQGTIITIEVNK